LFTTVAALILPPPAALVATIAALAARCGGFEQLVRTCFRHGQLALPGSLRSRCRSCPVLDPARPDLSVLRPDSRHRRFTLKRRQSLTRPLPPHHPRQQRRDCTHSRLDDDRKDRTSCFGSARQSTGVPAWSPPESDFHRRALPQGDHVDTRSCVAPSCSACGMRHGSVSAALYSSCNVQCSAARREGRRPCRRPRARDLELDVPLLRRQQGTAGRRDAHGPFRATVRKTSAARRGI
jgi:hypothetical protein